MKIHGAAAPIASANGVSTSAKTIESGTAIATEMTPPEIAFSQCDMRDTQGPQKLSFAQHRNGGGIPRYAEQRRGHGVGDVFGDDRREEERDDARAGGTPMSITSSASGATIAVSSVPEINPMPVKSTPARTAIPIAHRTGSMSSALTCARPSPELESRGFRQERRRGRGHGLLPGPKDASSRGSPRSPYSSTISLMISWRFRVSAPACRDHALRFE
jgi:hypothetical protein